MKQFRIWAAALALVLFATQAAAQPSPGTSPWPVTKGGTGANTAAGARTNLGLVIGTNVQAFDAELLAIAGLTSAADSCFYFTGSATAAIASCPTYGRSLMATASASAARTALGLVIGTDVQAQDVELAALAGLTSAADKCPYFTGSGTAALMDCSSALRTFLTTPNSANLRALLTDETGTGPAMFGTAPQVTGLFDINGALKYSTQSAPAQITSNQDNYNPSSVLCATTTTLLINSDAARNITGLAGGVAGCVVILVNNGSFTITLKEETTSTATNRFKTGADIALAANAATTLFYDGTASRWRLASLAPAAGAGTGTVTSVICNGVTITTSGTCPASVQPQGRLTLATATPVMTSTQSAKTTIFYTPYIGYMVPIYDGSILVPTAVAEISVATTDTTKNPAAIGASKVNDWFIWNDSGTIRISHGPDWTSDTARSAGTALTMVNGILLNNASITNGPAASRGTYVGTTRSNGSSQLDFIFGASNTAGFFGIWNMYNRVPLPSSVSESAGSHNYTSATPRQANASATWQVTFVVGQAEDAALATLVAQINTNAAANAVGYAAAALNSTSTFTHGRNFVQAVNSQITQMSATHAASMLPQLGVNVISANEASDGTNSVGFNASSANVLTATVRL